MGGFLHAVFHLSGGFLGGFGGSAPRLLAGIFDALSGLLCILFGGRLSPNGGTQKEKREATLLETEFHTRGEAGGWPMSGSSHLGRHHGREPMLGERERVATLLRGSAGLAV
jgi:hypothetical protein